MSYDLFFQSEFLTRERFFDYFADRLHYRHHEDYVFYENDDTGVDFFFSLPDEENEPGIAAEFKINLLRSCLFAAEAVIELEVFCREFSCFVLDPQIDDEFRPFDSGQFTASWNRVNRVAFTTDLHASQRLTLPQAELEYIWNWNYHRDALYEEIREDVYIARILLFEESRALRRVAVWTDGIPTVFPKIDYVMVLRDRIAPRRFLIGPRKSSVALLGFRELLPVLEPYGEFRADGAFYMRGEWTVEPPAALADYLRKLPVLSMPLAGVELDKVVEAEALETP